MKSIFTFVFSALSLALVAQRNFDGVQIEPVKVSGHVYVLFGSGGNIALVTGENQNYIIDDQFAPLSDKIEFAKVHFFDRTKTFWSPTNFAPYINGV